ncbi:MAG TPA: DUF1572 domain-containing protein [Flavobacteriales bacterium]
MQQAILANRLREVILNGKWVAGTNFREQLQELPWQIAVRQVSGLNTIALLAQHIHYYIQGIKQVLEGGPLEIRDKFSFDFAPIKSEGQWKAFLDIMWTDTEALAKLIAQFSDAELNLDFANKIYGTTFRNIDALIEHSYYHLGQIVLIKKIMSDR